MKKFKKIMALVIAMVMVLSMMSITAFAGDDDEQGGGEGGGTPAETKAYDYPITVTGLSTNPADETVNFYKIIEWVGETADHSDVKGWRAVSPYSSVLTKDKLTEVLLGTAAVEDDPTTPDDESQAAVAPGISSELAGALAKLAGDDGVPATKIENGTATLDNPAAGLWMALITPADANTIYNPVFVAADYDKDQAGTVAMTDSYNGDAVAKKSTLTLTKTAANANDYNSDNGKTTAVGDTVSFTVNTTIPAYGSVYEHPHFVLNDTLTDLKLKTDTVVVTGLEKGEDKDYTVSATDSGYTITFTEKYLKSLTVATAVEVKYDAIVTDSAAKAVNEEDNDVYIEYSHNPNQQTDYDVKKDTTQHYTFSIDAEGAGEGQSVSGKKTSEVVKIGVDAAGNPITSTTETSAITSTETWSGPLAGAKFGLFTDSAATIPYKAKNADGTAGTTAMEATTGADGRMNFAGLDAGTYYLKEISAPAGFVTNSTVHTIVIAAQTEEIEVTEWWNGSSWVSTKPASGTAKEVTYKTDVLKSYTVTIDGTPTATYTFKNDAESNTNEINWETAELVEKPFQLENTQGVELPSTGGIGTTIFYIVGAILVLGAGVVMVTRRRMDA